MTIQIGEIEYGHNRKVRVSLKGDTVQMLIMHEGKRALGEFKREHAAHIGAALLQASKAIDNVVSLNDVKKAPTSKEAM